MLHRATATNGLCSNMSSFSVSAPLLNLDRTCLACWQLPRWHASSSRRVIQSTLLSMMPSERAQGQADNEAARLVPVSMSSSTSAPSLETAKAVLSSRVSATAVTGSLVHGRVGFRVSLTQHCSRPRVARSTDSRRPTYMQHTCGRDDRHARAHLCVRKKRPEAWPGAACATGSGGTTTSCAMRRCRCPLACIIPQSASAESRAKPPQRSCDVLSRREASGLLHATSCDSCTWDDFVKSSHALHSRAPAIISESTCRYVCANS